MTLLDSINRIGNESAGRGFQPSFQPSFPCSEDYHRGPCRIRGLRQPQLSRSAEFNLVPESLLPASVERFFAVQIEKVGAIVGDERVLLLADDSHQLPAFQAAESAVTYLVRGVARRMGDAYKRCMKASGLSEASRWRGHLSPMTSRAHRFSLCPGRRGWPTPARKSLQIQRRKCNFLAVECGITLQNFGNAGTSI
jgi:hypothetical protein